MKIPNPLDEAQLRHEFRQLYKDIGYEGCIQVLYEFLIASNLLAEILLEERNKHV